MALLTSDCDHRQMDPMLKYFRCEDIEERLRRAKSSKGLPDHATDLSVTERFMALGTHNGFVHILDLDGNEVRTFSPHATVHASNMDCPPHAMHQIWTVLRNSGPDCLGM